LTALLRKCRLVGGRIRHGEGGTGSGLPFHTLSRSRGQVTHFTLCGSRQGFARFIGVEIKDAVFSDREVRRWRGRCV
jgi:hypothetical protein